MELFKSLESRTKSFNDPFKHFEINQPLTADAIKEISNANIVDPKKENLNYDGTRALDGGDGAFRSGIKDGGKAKKIRWFGIDREKKQKGLWENDITEIGYKYQMTDIAAVMGICGLESYKEQLDHRRKLLSRYITEKGI